MRIREKLTGRNAVTTRGLEGRYLVTFKGEKERRGYSAPELRRLFTPVDRLLVGDILQRGSCPTEFKVVAVIEGGWKAVLRWDDGDERGATTEFMVHLMVPGYGWSVKHRAAPTPKLGQVYRSVGTGTLFLVCEVDRKNQCAGLRGLYVDTNLSGVRFAELVDRSQWERPAEEPPAPFKGMAFRSKITGELARVAEVIGNEVVVKFSEVEGKIRMAYSGLVDAVGWQRAPELDVPEVVARHERARSPLVTPVNCRCFLDPSMRIVPGSEWYLRPGETDERVRVVEVIRNVANEPDPFVCFTFDRFTCYEPVSDFLARCKPVTAPAEPTVGAKYRDDRGVVFVRATWPGTVVYQFLDEVEYYRRLLSTEKFLAQYKEVK